MRESTPVDAAVGWSGFHAVERDLWQGGAITDETKKYSSDLVTNVGKLQASSRAGVPPRRPRQRCGGPDRRGPERQDHRRGGAVQPPRPGRLRRERRRRPAGLRLAAARPGEDRRRPGQDARRAVRVRAGDPRHVPRPERVGGYKTYTPELQASDAAKLTAVIQPLHETLATVAQKVVSASGYGRPRNDRSSRQPAEARARAVPPRHAPAAPCSPASAGVVVGGAGRCRRRGAERSWLRRLHDAVDLDAATRSTGSGIRSGSRRRRSGTACS